MTALAFNLVLCVMIQVMDREDEGRNRSFGHLAFVVFLGNALTCVTTFVRRADSFPLVPEIAYLAYLISAAANIYVTAFFSKYIESFFRKKHKPSVTWKRFNNGLLIAATILLIVIYIWKFPQFDGTAESANIDLWVKYIFGYAIELYFILYTLIYFIRYGKLLNNRQTVTAIWGILLTIGGILTQLVFQSILLNYVGASIGLYMFYFGVETPDYRKLMQTMEELKTAREAADRANRSKSEFLANMSHEIRTPINAVLGMNEMIIRESHDDKIIGYAKNVDSSGQTLLAIINDILDISKIEAGKLTITEAPYKLSNILNDVTNMVTIRAQAKKLEFDVYVDETLPDGLMGDEVRVRQMMLNLLTNAVKYTSEGSVSLSVEGDYDNDILNLIISVSDTGMGIKSEDKDKLFSQFERLDVVKNRSIEGTGLGLAITHDLAELMGGTISVESTYGLGSTFSVNIPQKIVSREQIGNFRAKRGCCAEAGAKERNLRIPEGYILVVDDTRINLMVFKELLKRTEIKIDTAESARDSILLAEKNKYDVIYMDQRMPIMDGTEALRVIKAQENGANMDTPIICLTADAVAGAKEKYIEEGFDDYLSKPVVSAQLEETLIKYVPKEKIIIEEV
ncbi:MAG: response regulator [Lachnospiraceae bacterium]|nr:response regulator [Lachnospiraceae bacterium]